jgi:hypothetical protein
MIQEGSALGGMLCILGDLGRGRDGMFGGETERTQSCIRRLDVRESGALGLLASVHEI